MGVLDPTSDEDEAPPPPDGSGILRPAGASRNGEMVKDRWIGFTGRIHLIIVGR